ncbi:MAG: hypothetical protein QOD60_2171 [Solirubrobacterales bacterium]|jgi:hypothetical protein|nr:hypothetical protein [Solirubrobacterales bacterium]
MRRPSLRGDRKKKPAKKPRKKVAKPKRPRDVRFRTATRVKAVGYGLREQAWRLSRGAEKVERRITPLWTKRSKGTRRRVLAVAGVLALYALLKFTPVPGVPCEISAAKECPPGDATVKLVPASALLYAHMTLDGNTAELKRLDTTAAPISRRDEVVQTLIDAATPATSAPINFAEVRPWAGNDFAVTVVPGNKAPPSEAAIVSIDDRKGAQAFIAKIAPGAPRKPKTKGQAIQTYANGFADAISGDFLFAGDEAAVRELLATQQGGVKSLSDDSTASKVRGDLPDNRFADVYVSGTGVQKLLAPSTSTAATQLETFVDYKATRGFAAAAIAQDNGIEIELVSALDAAKEKKSPNVFTTLPEFRPLLTRDVGANAIAYFGIGDAGSSLGTLLKRAGSAQPGLGAALAAFSQRLQAEAKVNPAKDLLPALGGEAALVAEPTATVPYASLIVDGVDEAKARAALARLQGPLVRAIGVPAGSGPLPGFQAVDIGGVTASSLQISPLITLTYAIFDGKLVISTQPAGVAQVKKAGSGSLASAATFNDATQHLPATVSSLVFLNLDELLDLAERLGRIEDPLYAAFRDDIRKLHAIAVGVNAVGDELRSRLFVTIK